MGGAFGGDDAGGRPVSFGTKLQRFLAAHWRGVVGFITPLAFLPLIVPLGGVEQYRVTAYTLCVMAVYWVSEAIPLPITGFIPVFMFPMFGIMPGNVTCERYVNDTIFVFLGSLMLAAAIEQSGLHTRMALCAVRTIGYSHYKLLFAMSFMSMFASMWMTNTAATTMFVPITFALLHVFEDQGLLVIYEGEGADKKASDITTCYFCSVTFSTTIGGIGTLVGTGTNLVFKGLLETAFPQAPEYLSFPMFSAFTIPPMILMEICLYFCMILVYLGFLRPNSETAKKTKISAAGMEAAKKAVMEQTEEIGGFSFWEIMVAILFTLAIMLFFTRSPQMFPGWGDRIEAYFKAKPKYIRDSAVATGSVLLMVWLPQNTNAFKNFSVNTKEQLPKKRIPSVLDWVKMDAVMPWSYMFLLGGGFSISGAASKEYSDLNGVIGKFLSNMSSLPSPVLLLVLILLTIFLTNFASNVAVATVIVPIGMTLAIRIGANPLLFNMAAGLAASFCFLLPVGTPGNLIVQSAAKISTQKMLDAGALPTVTTTIITWLALLYWAPVIWPDMKKHPKDLPWAAHRYVYKQLACRSDEERVNELRYASPYDDALTKNAEGRAYIRTHHSNETVVVVNLPRLRHSRHLSGFTPIHNSPANKQKRSEYANSTNPNGFSRLSVKDNHKPVFKSCSSYRPVVKEESPIGTYVFTILAVDIDPPEAGGTVTYKFVTTAGERERFTVQSETGEVWTNDVFDHDEPSREKEVYITLRATDNGHPSLDDACTIRIVIEDINDNQPVFDKVTYAESVPQDHQLNREVMRISATDIDDGKNSIVNYKLDPNTPDASYFYIDPSNGVIFLNKTIDKLPGYRFKLNAIVKDNGDPPQQNSITLDIQVVESNKKSPSFTKVPDGPIRLKENHHDFITPIVNVSATSNIPGEEDKVQFELVVGQTEQTNKGHSFVLEPFGDVGCIKLGALLDYERTNEFSLTVRIQNNYRLAAETIITVLVEDVNDNIPTFSEIRGGTVLENEPIGTQVMQVKAIDYDGTAPHNVVTYELADPTEPFAIDPINGNITTLKMFDREDRSFYNIKVLAIDGSESANVGQGAHNIGVQTFLVEIADRNDNPPNFTQDTYVAESIAENANINELVTQVTARDVDTASIVTYSIVSGNTYDSFTIRNFTGEIRVNKELDYENMTSFSLDVRAFDGIYEDYAKVIIKIENLNDNPPIFVSNYTKTIQEERLYEGCIVKVEAYDPDIRDRSAPQNIVYSLVKHEQKDFLEIDNEGCLRLTKPLDRDQPTGFTRWQVLIMAADHGGKLGSDSLRSTTEVILELTDINDNAPFLTNTQPVVWFENMSGGQVVALTAKDYDSPENGAPFTFAMNMSAASYKVKTKFEVIGTDLYATTTFDREEQKEYLIPILITDSGNPPMTGQSILRVVIGDRNDNPMAPGSSTIFVYNFLGAAPDMSVGRVYVRDPDDWDIIDKKFTWLSSYPKSDNFDVEPYTGMITMKADTPNGTYVLKFNVTEENEPVIAFHWVEATVTVTVKEIYEEAVDKSGSIRFINTTAEEFIIPEADGTSKKDKLHVRLSKLFNESLSNVDIFTVANKRTVKERYLDVRFSAHGSPFFSPEKMETMILGIQDKLEAELNLSIYMIHIDECLVEREQCDDSCRNVLIKNQDVVPVFTNTTSFIGVNAKIESECTCEVEYPHVCFNGGTPFADKCECPEGFTGPRCEQTAIGFHGDGWAMYPAPPACDEGTLSLTVTSHTSNALIFYMGPLKKNPMLPVEDFLSLELIEGFPVLMVNYGSGTTRINNSVIHVADGKPHFIEILLMKTSIEMFVDRCKLSTCMSLAAPTGTNQFLNIHGPLQLGGASVDLKALGTEFSWRYTPTDQPFVGCISNLTYNKQLYNLGAPAYHMNADPSCQRSMFTAVTFGINTNFLVAILVCSAILIVLLLAVVVHRRKQDSWAEKELDDIRENIIAYEDEGGGEGDAGYDLHVLRKMYEPSAEADNWRALGFIRKLPNSGLLVMREPVPKYVKTKKRQPNFVIGTNQITYNFYSTRIRRPERDKVRPGRLKAPPSPPRLCPILNSLDDQMVYLAEYLLYQWATLVSMNESSHNRVDDDMMTRESRDNVIELEEINERVPTPRRAPILPMMVSAEPDRSTCIGARCIDGPSRDSYNFYNARRQSYQAHPDVIVHQSAEGPTEPAEKKTNVEVELVGAAPDISGFLDDKKEVMDRDPDALNPFDDVRYYAYEGDGNSSGSLSSLASCTDDGDLKFNYLSTFGPRFRKLADLYHDSDEERHDRRDLSPQEESWC